jgi:hypothetical protein
LNHLDDERHYTTPVTASSSSSSMGGDGSVDRLINTVVKSSLPSPSKPQHSSDIEADDTHDIADVLEHVSIYQLLALCSWTIGVNFGFAAALELGTPLFVTLGSVCNAHASICV